jgi:hypothetical protein
MSGNPLLGFFKIRHMLEEGSTVVIINLLFYILVQALLYTHSLICNALILILSSGRASEIGSGPYLNRFFLFLN